MSQNSKLKFFAASSYDDEPLEPPPAYSATASYHDSSSLQTTCTAQQTKIQQVLFAIRIRIQECMTRNHQAHLGQGTEEDREVRRQLLHLMSEFLGKVSKDSPKSIEDLPASVHGVLKADLYVAPQEAVPLASGWHLSGVSQRDDEIIGRAVQEGRVWPTETPSLMMMMQKKENEAHETGSQSKPAELWSAVGALSLNEHVYESRGTLWWDNEREAKELARVLDLQLFSQCSTLPGADNISPKDQNTYVQVKIRAEDMTFRRENEMGLWESSSGWTIVMAVTLLY